MNKQHTYRHDLQTLRVYIYYRIAVSSLLFVMFYSGLATNVLGTYSYSLYFWASMLYAGQSFITLFMFPAKKLRYSTKRIALLLAIDSTALLLLSHASGGIDSGLAYLFIITVATVTVFIQGRLSLAYAASITILTLLDTLYLYGSSKDLEKTIFTSGTLGILLFTTAILLSFLTRKLLRASEESQKQNARLKHLQNIAQSIVTRMQTGVIVIGDAMRIELMNDSAKKILNIPADRPIYGSLLADYRELHPLLQQWEELLTEKSKIFKLHNNIELRINIAQFEAKNMGRVILYLEDYATIKQQAQQLKLASLGKLAASIAHEIRNPLGALSHAAQLLEESEKLANEDKRLTGIILKNSLRVNDIVENTLTMSRRKAPDPETIQLNTWLTDFIDDYNSSFQKNVQLIILNTDLHVRFDVTHFRQILNNLIDNAIYHGKSNTGFIEVFAGKLEHDDKAYIEIIDDGDGVKDSDIPHIFEPFFTTETQGSGLGLYICKELCEINQCTLHYSRTKHNKTCFRLNFSHHQRMQ